ncbi:hypothetical protein ACM8AQ_05390 [Pseudomonas aeruginosa]
MNKANECTCPSGDGSLVHPCPAHPAVEQAGGDERAAFEVWFAGAGYADNWNKSSGRDLPQHEAVAHSLKTYGPKDTYFGCCTQHLWESWQARAALAQPSPAQAEAERPEVVGYRSKESGMVYEQDYGLKNPEALTTVAECERIVGALRADRDSWAEQAEQRLADWDEMRKERDAALARVAELETALEPFAAVADAYDDSEDDDHEPYTDMGCDDRLRLTLGQHRAGRIALEGRTPQAQAQQLHDLDKQCRDDVARALGLRPNQERGFAWSYLLASIKSCVKASEDSAQAQHSVPEGLAEFSQFLSAVMDAAGLVRYGRRSKELSEYLGAQCMKYRLSAPVAQAQHSGPEEFSFEYRHPNGESHTVTVSRDQVISEMPDFLLEALCSKFCNCEPVGETNVVECCCDEYAEEFKLLAAAPGKEVPQAWLDVQAERRRQVEVEGYHGFRDNHYISYELSKAARAYIEVSWHALSGGLPCKKPESWPWMAGFKWSDGRTMLVKAGALILAEIERLDRAAPGKEVGHE